MIIQQRKRVLVNTDPQNRCYDGCYFSSEWRWTAWSNLEVWPGWSLEKAEERKQFWVELNVYAVSQRGKRAQAEFRILEDDK